MPEYPSVNHAGKPIHWVTIQMVRPGRLRVVNEEGNQGIIPEREWTLDRSMHRSIPTFVEGQRIPAVYLEDKSRPNLAHYSLAQMENPWKGLENRYQEGQAVTCEVVNLRNYAAFVQLEPGITAVVWDKDLPLFADQIPSDELVLGDKLRGVISKIDAKNQKIELDVNRYLEERAERELEEQAKENVSLFNKVVLNLINETSLKEAKQSDQYVDIPALNSLNSVLVVDDKEDHRNMIKNDLEKDFPVTVHVASSEKEGLKLFEAYSHFDLVVIDVNLGIGESGISLANKILARDANQNIIFFSSNLDIDKDILELEMNYARTFPKAIKIGLETKDLIECIDDLLRGRKRKRRQVIRNTPFSRDIGAGRAIEQVLTDLIEHLVEQEKLSHVFVLEVNLETRKTKVLAQYPPASGHSILDVDALYYSPVRKVIEEGEDFHIWEVSPLVTSDNRRLKNLFSNFSFQACFGTAVHLNAQSLKHALFVLDRDRSFLKQEIREKIVKCAIEVGTSLQRYRVWELLLRSQDTYYKGELLGTMIHELTNKLIPIRRNLGKSIKSLYENITYEKLDKFEKIQQDFENLYELFLSYIMVANENTEGVKLNKVVEKVILQQKNLAKDKIPRFHYLDKNLPDINSNYLQAEQVFTNVLLNAIQQTEDYLSRLRKISLERQSIALNIFTGAVTINTTYDSQRKLCKIIVVDSGPGISFDKRETIFEWGFTTREKGQGMGLYSSRSLAEAMGGRLILADTIRFVGSVFIIEFPIAT